jgi:hypothetical protein
MPQRHGEVVAKAAAAVVGVGVDVGVGGVDAVVAGAVAGAVTAGSLGFEPVVTFAARSVPL